MVRLTITSTMLERLEYCKKYELDISGEDLCLGEAKLGAPITHGQVVALSNILKKDPVDTGASFPLNHTLAELLRGSEVYIEPMKPKTEPTSEFKALMARLREEEEQRQYDRMINPPAPIQTFGQRLPSSNYAQLFPEISKKEEDEEVTLADVNRQVTLILNILISIIACAAAIWMATRYWPIPQRLGASMGGSGLVGVAEVVVYGGYLRRVKEAKQKEKKKVERKEIIETWVIEPKNHLKSTQASKELITTTVNDTSVRRRLTKVGNET